MVRKARRRQRAAASEGGRLAWLAWKAGNVEGGVKAARGVTGERKWRQHGGAANNGEAWRASGESGVNTATAWLLIEMKSAGKCASAPHTSHRGGMTKAA